MKRNGAIVLLIIALSGVYSKENPRAQTKLAYDEKKADEYNYNEIKRSIYYFTYLYLEPYRTNYGDSSRYIDVSIEYCFTRETAFDNFNLVEHLDNQIKKSFLKKSSQQTALEYIKDNIKAIRQQSVHVLTVAREPKSNRILGVGHSVIPRVEYVYDKKDTLDHLNFWIDGFSYPFLPGSSDIHDYPFSLINFSYSIIDPGRVYRIYNISFVQEGCSFSKNCKQIFHPDLDGDACCYTNADLYIHVTDGKIKKIERFEQKEPFEEKKLLYTITYNSKGMPEVPVRAKVCATNKHEKKQYVGDLLLINMPTYWQIFFDIGSLPCRSE